MTAKTNTDQPAEYVQHDSLAAALAAFQLHLPRIGKDNTAQVKSEKGSYSYKYADLSDVNGTVLPALARHGLSFSAKPTLTEDGRFVLAYVLRHESGGVDEGSWPLPTSGTPQQIGSAVTYYRRYALCAVTGVAPDDDDDGQAAQREHTYERPPAARSQPPRNGTQNSHQPEPDAPPPSPADRARADLLAACEKNGWKSRDVAAEFSKRHDGADLRTEEYAPRITAFTKLLPDVFGAPAATGAQQ